MSALPLTEIPSPPVVAALPKADLHLHQEQTQRLDRVLARREGRAPNEWRARAGRLIEELSPGSPRLSQIGDVQLAPLHADAEPANVIARLEDLLEEEAADGAVFLAVRSGGDTALRAELPIGLRSWEEEHLLP